MSRALKYNSDPEFKVFKVPNWRAKIYWFFSIKIWGGLPSSFQRWCSKIYANIYHQPISKYWILPYVRFHYKKENYLDLFQPPNGKNKYESFQDFFIREFKELPKPESSTVFGCEGLLCHSGFVYEIPYSIVKQDKRGISTIFGLKELPKNYFFTNIFLHNKNYHRIHAPVAGKIKRIQHIPGDLVLLRPWIYKQNPTTPAFRNERYNIDIIDEKGKFWHISIVGGPAVGSIQLSNHIKVGSQINCLQELAVFYLGSTCCIAAPVKCKINVGSFVEIQTPFI